MPHRDEKNLKPAQYTTYEHFYNDGAVKLSASSEITPVSTIVLNNRAAFEQLDEHLQEVWQSIQEHGHFEDTWADIAP